MKKLLAITLSLVMVFSLLAVCVSADDVVYSWPLEAANFALSDDTTGGDFYVRPDSNDTYHNGTRYVASDAPKDSSVTFTSINTVEAGVYATALYGREFKGSSRAQLSVTINSIQVADLIDMNTTKTAAKNKKFDMGSITIAHTSTIVMTVTAETAGSIYLNSLELTKTADYVASNLVPVTTEDGASIRLNSPNGIRFYTTFDQDAIDALNTENETVEFGTLIGPQNLVGDELDIDDVTANNAVNVKYTSLEFWGDNEDQFVGSIANIKDYNIARVFVGRGYVKIGDTYYYSESSSTRSLASVAYTYKTTDSGYNSLDAELKENVDTWAAAYTA